MGTAINESELKYNNPQSVLKIAFLQYGNEADFYLQDGFLVEEKTGELINPFHEPFNIEKIINNNKPFQTSQHSLPFFSSFDTPEILDGKVIWEDFHYIDIFEGLSIDKIMPAKRRFLQHVQKENTSEVKIKVTDNMSQEGKDFFEKVMMEKYPESMNFYYSSMEGLHYLITERYFIEAWENNKIVGIIGLINTHENVYFGKIVQTTRPCIFTLTKWVIENLLTGKDCKLHYGPSKTLEPDVDKIYQYKVLTSNASMKVPYILMGYEDYVSKKFPPYFNLEKRAWV